MPTDHRAALERAARDLLQSLVELPKPRRGLRLVDAGGGLACLILVWDAAREMPVAAAERRRRAGGGRQECKKDIMEVVSAAARPLTRKEVFRALRAAGKEHGAGTVAKALADLVAAKELVNPRDRRGYRLPERWRREKTPSLFE
jgi:hypothetical protein